MRPGNPIPSIGDGRLAASAAPVRLAAPAQPLTPVMAKARAGGETPRRSPASTRLHLSPRRNPPMTLAQLKDRYAQLSVEIDALADAGGHSEAKLARLTHDLDEIDREFVALRRRAASAPTLSDVVSWI